MQLCDRYSGLDVPLYVQNCAWKLTEVVWGGGQLRLIINLNICFYLLFCTVSSETFVLERKKCLCETFWKHHCVSGAWNHHLSSCASLGLWLKSVSWSLFEDAFQITISYCFWWGTIFQKFVGVCVSGYLNAQSEIFLGLPFWSAEQMLFALSHLSCCSGLNCQVTCDFCLHCLVIRHDWEDWAFFSMAKWTH